LAASGCPRRSGVRLDDVPDGYRAMNDREAIKVLIAF
jgi:threonine dehydrogenase-like Zn-dependent dehydrogenase